MSAAASWYEFRDGSQLASVRLLHHSKDRYWNPQVLAEQPLPGEVRAPEVRVEGPGAVWMYAHVGAWAGALGKSLDVVVIHRGGSGGVRNCKCRLEFAKEDSRAFLEVNMPRAVPLAPPAVDALIESMAARLGQQRPETLVIGGRASVKVYAKLAHAAVSAGTKEIACWSARDGLILVFPLQKAGDQRRRPYCWLMPWVRPRRSMIWGVIGDPHRGKSVFSEVLLNCLEAENVAAWKLDCDGASPTPPWFTTDSDNPQIKDQREALKLRWTPSMESTITQHLSQGRELFEVLIADLPGGNHKAKPPQRIPSSREEMFRQIDKFILLTDAQGGGEQGWREALENYGLLDRLVAVLVSEDPQAEPSFCLKQKGPILRGRVTGLDRARKASAIAKAMQPQIQVLLDLLRTAPGG